MTKEQQKIIAYESVIKVILDGIDKGELTQLSQIRFLLEYTLNENKGE